MTPCSKATSSLIGAEGFFFVMESCVGRPGRGKLSRGGLIGLAGPGAAAVLLSVALGGVVCKSPSETAPPPPVTVTVRATFYNHTQGPLGEKVYSGISGQPLLIRVNDISASNIDSQRIAVRQAGAGSGLGPLVGFSRNGEVSTTYPSSSGNWEVYLMNTGAGADYSLIDYWVDKGEGKLLYSPDAKWFRQNFNGYTGPEEPINDAINQLNNTLNYSWKKYGSYNKVSNGGNFGVGYDYCSGNAGISTSVWAGCNPNICTTYVPRLKIFLDEIFELQTQVDDIGGSSSNSVICDLSTGNLNAIGRDLLGYVYVKDEKTAGTSKSGISFRLD